jgi:hypothetical protein
MSPWQDEELGKSIEDVMDYKKLGYIYEKPWPV